MLLLHRLHSTSCLGLWQRDLRQCGCFDKCAQHPSSVLATKVTFMLLLCRLHSTSLLLALPSWLSQLSMISQRTFVDAEIWGAPKRKFRVSFEIVVGARSKEAWLYFSRRVVRFPVYEALNSLVVVTIGIKKTFVFIARSIDNSLSENTLAVKRIVNGRNVVTRILAMRQSLLNSELDTFAFPSTSQRGLPTFPYLSSPLLLPHPLLVSLPSYKQKKSPLPKFQYDGVENRD